MLQLEVILRHIQGHFVFVADKYQALMNVILRIGCLTFKSLARTALIG